jgi:MFS family permease
LSETAGHKRILSFAFPSQTLTRDIWLICLSNIIGAFGEGLYFWIFPLYVKTLNADYVQLGIVFSALFGVSALAPLPGGFLADRFDRKKLLILSWTPWIFAPFIYSFADNWTQLIPGTICWGASMIGLPAVTAYVITAVDDKKKLASVLSIVWSSYSFSYIFAPSVGGYLAKIIGMRSVLRVSALLAAASTAVFFFLHSQHPQKTGAEKREQSFSPSEKKRLWRRMLIWAGFSGAAAFLISIARPYVPTLLDEQIGLSEFQIGLFGSVNYAGITFIGIALGHLGDRWRKSGAFTLCLLLYIASIVPLILIRDTATPMFLALMLTAFILGGSGVSGSLVSSFVGTIAPQARQGLWVSIPQTLSLLCSFAAPYLGGYLYSFSPNNAFIVSVSGIPFLAVIALAKLHD